MFISFQKKANKKRNKKPTKSTENGEAIESHTPGRYVLLHRDAEPDRNPPTKRKLSETKNGVDKDLPSNKKQKLKNQTEKDEPISAEKKKKLKNVPFTKKLSQTDQQDGDDTQQQNGNNSFRQTLIDKLKGSRFRYLNELLYTKQSSEATAVFEDDPTSFQAYHEGYRQQVQQWPLNPLDRMIKAMKRL